MTVSPSSKFKAVNDAHQTILAEVAKARPQKSTNTGVMIRCPFHPDNTPSLSINLTHSSKVPVGVWNCFGCSEKGKWNKLAERMRWRQIDQEAVTKVTEFHGRDVDKRLLSTDSLHDEMITHFDLGFVEPWPDGRKWRGFPSLFLQHLGFELAVDDKRKEECVLMPVMVGGEPQGYVKARMTKAKGQLSYVNMEGPWSKRTGLLGYDLAQKLMARCSVLFVVEGPRDAMRLLYYGVPAVALLGAKMWGPSKRDLVLSLGAQLVVLFFDSDPAGISATNTLRKDLQSFTRVNFVNTKKLEDKAKKEGWSGNKLDVANAPLDLFLSTCHKYGADPVAGAWSRP